MNDSLSRLEALLADRAVTPFGPWRRGEIDRLARRHPRIDLDAFDLAAAAIALARLGIVVPPERLVAELERAARVYSARFTTH